MLTVERDYKQMGLCSGPEVPNCALIRSRAENKTEAIELELKGQYVYLDTPGTIDMAAFYSCQLRGGSKGFPHFFPLTLTLVILCLIHFHIQGWKFQCIMPKYQDRRYYHLMER